MNAAKQIGANVALVGAAFSVFLGFGYTLGVMNGNPVEDNAAWLWYWAGVSSLTLAVTLATFAFDIANTLEASWTSGPRGRHARR